jgi:hypothetical protein
MSSVMPSTELRRNVTRRRSNDRTRDSVGSTSVPIRSLVSRKPMERQKDMIYASESMVAGTHERGESIATSAQSPGITRRQIPSEEEDPLRHRVLQEMWVRKKILEEDIDEALENQNSNEFHNLVQQHKKLNQDMFAMLRGLSGSSTPMERKFHLDEESFVVWLAYDGDEISVVAWPQMTVKLLIERTVEILGDRGVSVMFEQILLRHEGKTFDEASVLSDYNITSDDMVEVLVSRSVRSPSTNLTSGSIAKADNLSHNESPRDIFFFPRDIFVSRSARSPSTNLASGSITKADTLSPNEPPFSFPLVIYLGLQKRVGCLSFREIMEITEITEIRQVHGTILWSPIAFQLTNPHLNLWRVNRSFMVLERAFTLVCVIHGLRSNVALQVFTIRNSTRSILGRTQRHM